MIVAQHLSAGIRAGKMISKSAKRTAEYIEIGSQPSVSRTTNCLDLNRSTEVLGYFHPSRFAGLKISTFGTAALLCANNTDETNLSGMPDFAPEHR